MLRATPLLLAATAMVLSGCAAGKMFRAGPQAATPSVVAPNLLAGQAEAALASGQPQAAVTFAELAVRADMADIGARLLLARGYMAAGRVTAAAESYGDVLDLDAGHAKARLGRALMRLAAGDRAGALADLETLSGQATEADRGLALALAGETARAVEVLTAGARRADADARVRQNLALALALDGQWDRARAVAAQDLDPATVDARMRDWAALAAEAGPAARTGMLLAVVHSADDPGRPVALAATASPQPEAVAAVSAEAPVPAPASVTVADAPVQPVAGPSNAPVQIERRGNWAVQVGAYRDPALRAAHWARLAASDPALAGARPLEDVVGGLHRLAVGGLDRAAAARLCMDLRQRGDVCFLRAAPAKVMLAARLD
jgi:Flp pilus assembly protein TadD